MRCNIRDLMSNTQYESDPLVPMDRFENEKGRLGADGLYLVVKKIGIGR